MHVEGRERAAQALTRCPRNWCFDTAGSGRRDFLSVPSVLIVATAAAGAGRGVSPGVLLRPRGSATGGNRTSRVMRRLRPAHGRHQRDGGDERERSVGSRGKCELRDDWLEWHRCEVKPNGADERKRRAQPRPVRERRDGALPCEPHRNCDGAGGQLERGQPLSANMTETPAPLGITVGRWR